MDINNLKSCVSHDEAMIRSFIRDPEYANYYLNAVIADGDNDEIHDTQAWYNEAQSRSYWAALIHNAENTAKNGKNIQDIIQMVKEALNILKAALPAQEIARIS